MSITTFPQNNQAGKNNTSEPEAIRKKILQLEEMGRQRALNGETNWDDMMADSAYLIQWDGSVMIYEKGQTLPSLPLKSFRLSDIIVRVYGEVAVVTGFAEIESETAEKKPFSFQMRYLNVWQKYDDGWKMVVTERTPVRQAPK